MTALDRYLFYWEVKYHSVVKTDVDVYKESQKIFKEVQKIHPQFSMKNVHDYVDERIQECYDKLREADQFTMMLQNKTPEECPQWKSKAK